MSRTVMDLWPAVPVRRYLLPELAMLELLSMDARKTFVRRVLSARVRGDTAGLGGEIDHGAA